MSVNYGNFTKDTYINKRTREQLEKYKKGFDRTTVDFVFPYTSMPIDIENIVWSELKGVEYAQWGSSSVFLCGFPQNQACVIKGISNTVQELFTSLIHTIMNVHVHKMKVIQHTLPEFKKVIRALEKVSIFDKYLENCIYKELDRPFFLVQDYIPSIGLLQMGKNRAEACFGVDDEFGYRRLREIGEIIAVDILLNNSSRVPVLWNTEGNANNFIIAVDGVNITSELLLDAEYPVKMTHIYALDSECYCLNKMDENSEKVYNQYMERVERFVRGTVRDLEEALQQRTLAGMTLPTMEVAMEFFYKHCRVELNNQQLFQVLKGVMGTFREIAGMEIEEIEHIYRDVKFKIDSDWMDVWANGIAAIRPDFIIDVKYSIQKVVEANLSSFEWVYRMYKIDDSPLYF
ncbi:hypothetical protein SteCoe_10624 [Stentor coeruleus]|uniref:Actin-fragmin kinase catalytic domain-containing protein n=1 Tax=Stentor coeruleus TaxID=5963 RepID=A0A1R2CF23_9CILI|nr:hypothetical protein SteCoe_10624 [Stentor coeruleus]